MLRLVVRDLSAVSASTRFRSENPAPDLQPDNVMLLADAMQPQGVRTKILDFGIAKLSSGSDGTVRTETGAMIGTPAYMSPEQCVGAATVDGKADVYALGVMLYEMLAHRLPFECEHSFDFMAAHVRDKPAPLHGLLPDIPSEIDDLVMSMLAKQAAERPSMEAVVGLLEQAQALMPELGKTAIDVAGETSPGVLALEATVSGPGRPAENGRISGGAGASGRRVSKEQIELGETVPGVKSLERKVSRDALVPLAPSSSSLPAESRSRESPAPAGMLSAAESLERHKQRRLVAAVGGLLLVAAAALALSGRGHQAAPHVAQIAATGAAIPTSPASAVRMVHWNVSTIPPGAIVRSQGQELGKTPWESERPAGAGETAITLRLAGYQDKTIVLNHSIEVRTEIKLTPIVPPAPTAPIMTTGAAAGGETSDAGPHGPAKNKGGKSRKSRPAGDEVKLLFD